MGHFIAWVTFLTAIVVSCSIPQHIKFRRAIKGYLIAFWMLPIIALCCMGFYAPYFPYLLKGTFIPTAKVIENEKYILREAPFDIRMRGNCLYLKRGVLEVYQGDTGQKEQDDENTYIDPMAVPAHIQPVSLDVSPERDCVTIVCTDTILTYKIIKM